MDTQTPTFRFFICFFWWTGGVRCFSAVPPPPPRVVGRKVFNYKDRRTAVPLMDILGLSLSISVPVKKENCHPKPAVILEKSVPAHPFSGLHSLLFNFLQLTFCFDEPITRFLVTQSLNTTIQRCFK